MSETFMQKDHEYDEWITLKNSELDVILEIQDSGDVILTTQVETSMGYDERYMRFQADEVLALRDLFNKAYDKGN